MNGDNIVIKMNDFTGELTVINVGKMKLVEAERRHTEKDCVVLAVDKEELLDLIKKA